MDLDLAMMMVWLFLWLSLGVMGLLMTVALANTLSMIKPSKTKKRQASWLNIKTLRQVWAKRTSLQSPIPEPNHHSEGLGSEISSPRIYAPDLPPLACELEVRSAPLSSSCCLLHTKQGSPLHGGAISTRLTRLRRMGVLL